MYGLLWAGKVKVQGLQANWTKDDAKYTYIITFNILDLPILNKSRCLFQLFTIKGALTAYKYLNFKMEVNRLVNQLDFHTGLEWIMSLRIRNIMEVPTKDQIFDFVSFKFGALYKRYWRNTINNLKQSTFKAGEIIMLAQKMREITRSDDRLIKVCAYAREIRKFQSQRYQEWKNHIWADLDETDKILLQDYVNNLTPPVPNEGESKTAYAERERAHMYKAYKRMNRAMLILEILDKIWTIRQYEADGKPQDAQRHRGLAREMLAQMLKIRPNFRGEVGMVLGLDEWKVIERLW